MNLRRLALTLALSLAPFVIAAADLPVSYLVEEKPLKAAITGTPLTVELYSDNACTTLVQLVPVDVEDVTLLLKLKQMTPKNDAKLPNTVEMRTTLANVSGSGNLYLKVTGMGVSSVDGDCQAQSAQVAPTGKNLPVASALLSPVNFNSWFVTNCSVLPGGPVGNYLDMHTTEQAALVLSGLTRVSSRHLCDVRTSASASYNDTDLGVRAYLIFGIDNCTNVCADLIQNYDQSDIDCDGTAQCPRCGAGKACTTNSDCLSNVCTGNVCQP